MLLLAFAISQVILCLAWLMLYGDRVHPGKLVGLSGVIRSFILGIDIRFDLQDDSSPDPSRPKSPVDRQPRKPMELWPAGAADFPNTTSGCSV